MSFSLSEFLCYNFLTFTTFSICQPLRFAIQLAFDVIQTIVCASTQFSSQSQQNICRLPLGPVLGAHYSQHVDACRRHKSRYSIECEGTSELEITVKCRKGTVYAMRAAQPLSPCSCFTRARLAISCCYKYVCQKKEKDDTSTSIQFRFMRERKKEVVVTLRCS